MNKQQELVEIEVELTEEEKFAHAEKTKEDGNIAYKSKDYASALKHYTEAIQLCPKCSSYYNNRAAVFMMLSKYSDALEDARQSTRLDPNFVKGYLRAGKIHLNLGEAKAAINQLETASTLSPQDSNIQTELKTAQNLLANSLNAEKCMLKEDFRSTLYYTDRCIDTSPNCPKFKITKAECLALLKRFDEALNISLDILRQNSLDPDATYVRGLCLYYQDNIDKAFNHFQQVLRLAPDHAKAKIIYKQAKNLLSKKEEGNLAFKNRNWSKAFELYSEALLIDALNIFTNSKLFCNRAAVNCKLNKLNDAINDCSSAIKLDDSYIKAYSRRGKCYLDTEQYEEAVRDYDKVYEMDKNRENKQNLQNAKLELKKSKRKDFYKILGVAKNATDDEIRKAYRKRALLHHPDRHSTSDESSKKDEEKKFKEIGEAYAVLSDATKRSRFDNGQDLEETGGFGEGVDPDLIFQSFFGGGGRPAGGGFQFQQQRGGFPSDTFSFSF